MLSAKKLTVVMLVALLALAACQATPAPEAVEKIEAVEEAVTEAVEKEAEEPQVTQTGVVIGLAVHESPAESSFWGVVETGAKDAAALWVWS
jgi:hypothetical protein